MGGANHAAGWRRTDAVRVCRQEEPDVFATSKNAIRITKLPPTMMEREQRQHGNMMRVDAEMSASLTNIQNQHCGASVSPNRRRITEM